ncbi:Spermatogenesis-Associated Protein 31D3 [Manis pentadactyla]|nr:Spermatogenesis-Associated Protein 31D3 [Manis pentadactyla]
MDLRTYKIMSINVLWYKPKFQSVSQVFKAVELRQGRAQRRRRRGTLKGCDDYTSEEEEKQQLIALLRSSLGQNYDITCCRQVLCPDPFCQVCNSTTAEVHRLLCPEVLEDATPSVYPSASSAPVTDSSGTVTPVDSAVSPGDPTPASLSEPSPPPPCILSPNPMTPLGDFSSPSLVCHTLPQETFPSLDSIFPVDCSQTQTLAFPPPPPYDTQAVDPLFHPEAALSVNTISPLSQDINALPDLFQTINPTDSFPCPHITPFMPVAAPPDCNLTVTPSKSISISSIPTPESSSPGSPGGFFTYDPRTRGIDHSSLSTSDCSWGQDHANEEFLALHSSENSFRRDPAAITTESGKLSFLSRDALELLERQVHKKSNFLLWKEKEKKEGSFPKQLRAEYQLNSPGKMLQSVTDKHDSKGASDILHLEKDVGKGQGQSPESGRKDLLLCDPEGSSYDGLGYDSEKELDSHMVSLSRGLGEYEGWRELVNILEAHSSKKFQEISEGQLPRAVQNSWHTMEQRLLPEKSHTEVKESTLPPSVDEDYERNTFQDLSFTDSSVKQGKKTEKILKPVSELSVSRDILRVAEVDSLQGQIHDTLTTRKPGSSQMKNMNGSVTTESPPPNISGSGDVKSTDLRQQLLKVLKVKPDSENCAQAKGQSTDMFLDSDSLMSKASLTHAQSAREDRSSISEEGQKQVYVSENNIEAAAVAYSSFRTRRKQLRRDDAAVRHSRDTDDRGGFALHWMLALRISLAIFHDSNPYVRPECGNRGNYAIEYVAQLSD